MSALRGAVRLRTKTSAAKMKTLVLFKVVRNNCLEHMRSADHSDACQTPLQYTKLVRFFSVFSIQMFLAVPSTLVSPRLFSEGRRRPL